jgi:hypothetical protein
VVVRGAFEELQLLHAPSTFNIYHVTAIKARSHPANNLQLCFVMLYVFFFCICFDPAMQI